MYDVGSTARRSRADLETDMGSGEEGREDRMGAGGDLGVVGGRSSDRSGLLLPELHLAHLALDLVHPPLLVLLIAPHPTHTTTRPL
ncbi:hypothetical protein CVT25_008848 [Psilocybe cyanescens]|uniref:Uncharacterized protein n=1 Tax=Psilocybe cyanescens TaxID=93625 RepID=A0A409XAN3_PSICY|nr:hypothetical protein CVT25_008848 [Psilocybe cyanescens]